MSYQKVTYLDKLRPTNPSFQELPNYNQPPAGFDIPQPGPVYNQARDRSYEKFIRHHDRGNSIAHQMSGMGVTNPHSAGGYVATGPGGYHIAQPPQEVHEYYDNDSNPAADNYDFDASPAEENASPATSAQEKKKTECSCRDVYDHINGCNICKSFYMEGRNNAVLYIVIVLLFLIIAFLTTKVYDIHLKR